MGPVKLSRLELELSVYHHCPVFSPLSEALPKQFQSSVVGSAEAREGSRAQRQWAESTNWGLVVVVEQLVPVRTQEFIMGLVDMFGGIVERASEFHEEGHAGLDMYRAK